MQAPFSKAKCKMQNAKNANRLLRVSSEASDTDAAADDQTVLLRLFLQPISCYFYAALIENMKNEHMPRHHPTPHRRHPAFHPGPSAPLTSVAVPRALLYPTPPSQPHATPHAWLPPHGLPRANLSQNATVLCISCLVPPASNHLATSSPNHARPALQAKSRRREKRHPAARATPCHVLCAASCASCFRQVSSAARASPHAAGPHLVFVFIISPGQRRPPSTVRRDKPAAGDGSKARARKPASPPPPSRAAMRAVVPPAIDEPPSPSPTKPRRLAPPRCSLVAGRPIRGVDWAASRDLTRGLEGSHPTGGLPRSLLEGPYSPEGMKKAFSVGMEGEAGSEPPAGLPGSRRLLRPRSHAPVFPQYRYESVRARLHFRISGIFATSVLERIYLSLAWLSSKKRAVPSP